MEKETKLFIHNEVRALFCSLLIDEVRTKVQRLRSYGVNESEIEAIIFDEVALPKLVITEDYQIMLHYNKIEQVTMEPLLKSVYLLFLKHPEGIPIKCLPDYKEELMNIYGRLRPQGWTDRARKSIEDVTNPTMNSINEKCTKVNRIFKSLLPRGLESFCSISGNRGESKTIALPRKNVTWECDL